jgi:S-adenosylmethionine:tRNA ribosyltransferase-isomerase
LPELLQPGDLLVLNDTRVMAARLHGTRPDTGGRVEALLLREVAARRWEVLFKPARRAVPGRRFRFQAAGGPVHATVLSRAEEMVALEFEQDIDPARAGAVPLPPYINRYRGDPARYQTIYAREARSAAAPTAGLHFTPELFAHLGERGIETTAISLDIGPGTFKPVNVDDPRDFDLHPEFVRVGPEAAAAITTARQQGRRIVAVGTTAVRSLEHVVRERGGIEPYEGWTRLKILSADEFRVTGALITNFHLPRSTLLMLVSALAGHDLTMAAYRRAVALRFRFYSFGDAMLIT